jgi:hypothetical protein
LQTPLNKTINDLCTPEHEEDLSAVAGRLFAIKKRRVVGDARGHGKDGPEARVDGEEEGGGPTSLGSAVDDGEDDGQGPADENGEYPFQPSTWNSELAPSRSSLKTPDNLKSVSSF